MSRTKKILILANLLLLIGYINWSIVAKENTLSKGRLVLLELAPVDPRSLIQGDYMSLRYSISQLPYQKKVSKRGYCIVTENAQHVATFVRFQDSLTPLKSGEFAVKYYSSGYAYASNVQLGAESYFFEEGSGKKYERAKYGALKIDDAGNSVLVGLYDENYKLIK
ncbi:GDYXXLXY domain-containing protein [Pedobacter duraquae]|uniref:Putative membrane-anchored protein n=1 Tax=Pedobacter duraquae TaxID=425511 RepID=A0A4R6IC81_9SPHI|nr:GDYXXLXY domain-containing protein [Pedobacter duraquae]TDO19542.1 putative membrane-anchored protein [Pedobacter duraquae]